MLFTWYHISDSSRIFICLLPSPVYISQNLESPEMAPVGTLWAVSYQPAAKCVRYIHFYRLGSYNWSFFFFLFCYRLNQSPSWEASRSLNQLHMSIWRIIRNQSSWKSSPMARSRLTSPSRGSSSSRESLSHVMVRKRLFSYHTDRGFIIYGLDRPFKVDLKVMVDMFDDLNFFFSLSLSLYLYLFHLFLFFLSGENADPYQSNRSGWPCSKLWSSRWIARGNCSCRSMGSSCWKWSLCLYQFCPWTLFG